MAKCTKEAMQQVRQLRTRFPWAVVNNDQIIVAVFNYRAEAKEFWKRDKENLAFFDASGCVFEEVTNG